MIESKKILHKGWSTLTEYTLTHHFSDGSSEKIKREVFDSGNGASVLLFNSKKRTVILTRQFRIAAFVSGHADGKIIEACAGLLDNLNPEDAIKKEILEETGYNISNVEKLYSLYPTPGAHTERLTLFLAEYKDEQKVSEGGGLESEHEEIEVLEISFEEIKAMLNGGKLEDAKTIILVQHAILRGIIS